MFIQKIKKNGQIAVGIIFVVILLVILAIFIFFLIQPPEPSPPPSFTGLSSEHTQEAIEKAKRIEQRFPIARILPHGGRFDDRPFFIYDPLEDGTIRIDLYQNVPDAQDQALYWLRYRGYNPDNLKLDFRSVSPPSP